MNPTTGAGDEPASNPGWQRLIYSAMALEMEGVCPDTMVLAAYADQLEKEGQDWRAIYRGLDGQRSARVIPPGPEVEGIEMALARGREA